MSFRSQAASKLRRLIFAKYHLTPTHRQYHSLSSTTAATRRSHLTNLSRSRVGACFSRSIYTGRDDEEGSEYPEVYEGEKQKAWEKSLEERTDVWEEILTKEIVADIESEDDKEDDDKEDEEDEDIDYEKILDADDDEEDEKDEEDEEDEEDKEDEDLDEFEKILEEEERQNRALRLEEYTDSDSDDEDKNFKEAQEKEENEREIKLEKYEELFHNFDKSKTLDDALKWMEKAIKFKEKFLSVRPEYRVIGELMNRLKETTDLKEKFLLQHKINRGLRMVEFREKFNPKDPANYGLINVEQAAEISGGKDEDKKNRFQEKRKEDEEDKEDKKDKGWKDDEDDHAELEFDAEKEKDDILLENLAKIDKKLEEKLAALDHTFGKKGKLLEAEIRDLAEERSALTEKRRRPKYRIGFDVYPIYLNRTCKVTKGGQVKSYTAIVACGNYNGVVGFAKAKGPGGPIAYQKAYEKCFQNLHTIELHEEHTIAHAVQAEYKKTKVYLWPARTQTGMKAGKTVQAILNLAGFKNIKSKVIGSRNPHNTIKALFKALNAIETPKDVQEKYGRTVVETYLL